MSSLSLMMSRKGFRSLARIVGGLTLIGGDKIVTFKFPSPRED